MTLEKLELIIEKIGEDLYQVGEIEKIFKELGCEFNKRTFSFYSNNGIIKETSMRFDGRTKRYLHDIDNVIRFVFVMETKELSLEQINKWIDLQKINRNNYKEYFMNMIKLEEHMKEYFNI